MVDNIHLLGKNSYRPMEIKFAQCHRNCPPEAYFKVDTNVASYLTVHKRFIVGTSQ